MTKTHLLINACFAAAFVLLTGCAESTDVVALDSYTNGYRITCGGSLLSHYEDCYGRAESICKPYGGYTVVKEDDSPHAHSDYWWTSTTHELIMKCNGQ